MFKWKRESAAAFIASGIVLFLAAYGAFSPKQVFSHKENRFLADRPAFSWRTLADGSFEDKYETYLSDQFPFREQFVAAKTALERSFLRQDGNGVYFGKDGYFIEKVDPEQLYTEQLEKNLTYLARALEDWEKTEAAGKIRVMLIPSASQVLKNKLPVLAEPADQGGVVKRLRELLPPSLKDSVVLPVEDSLKAHADEPVYYRTDHHWTTLGAFYAYELFAKSAGLRPPELESFEQLTVTGGFLGTIESKVNVPMKPDSIQLFLPKAETAFQVFYDGQETAHSSLYQMEALEGKDKYAVFLDGNHGLTKIVNQNRPGEGKRKLLIIKDSYAHCFAPFAALHFDQVNMIDLRYYNGSLKEFMEQENITDILVLYQVPGFAKDKNLFKIVR